MSENKFPEEAQTLASDVEQKDVEQKVDLSEKSLAELSGIFEQLKDAADAMTRSKEAEAIKSAFYKLLLKLKGENPQLEEETDSRNNPFEQVEENFKALYADYKAARAEYNREQDSIREENLKTKQQIVEDLKALVEKQEDVSATFPAFREIQDRWREIGAVPAQNFRDINNTYQLYVEQFYDKLDKTLFFHKWSRTNRPLSRDSVLMAKAMPYSEIIPYMTFGDRMSTDATMAESYIVHHFTNDRDSLASPAFDRAALLFAMNSKDSKLFWKTLFEYLSTSDDEKLPKHVQEAALLFSSLENENLGIPFDKTVKDSFKSFQQNIDWKHQNWHMSIMLHWKLCELET